MVVHLIELIELISILNNATISHEYYLIKSRVSFSFIAENKDRKQRL